ncbi:MAG TPA: outer membrane protein transport protein [Longimicrobiaceae bacterium]|nr:outer membrane protein transport protein [Longimicrobiaceae bacterium]
MRRSLRSAGFVLAALAASAATIQAQGSNVMQHGACATAMVGAGVASPCTDGSAILFNPAGLVTHSSVVGLGVSAINTSATFTYDITEEVIEQDATTTPVPAFFGSYRFNDRWAAGLGVFAPYGLGIEWPVCSIEMPNCDDTNFEGRFVTYDTKLTNIYIQPTVAFAASDWLSIGAGVDIVRGSIGINQRVDLATTDVPGAPITFAALGIPLGTDFADANLEGAGTGVGFHLGAMADLSEKFSVGVRYLHSVEINYEGDAMFKPVATGLVTAPNNPLGAPENIPLDAVLAPQFAEGGALANQDIATSLTLPYQLVVGFAFRPMDELELKADYQYTGWESFDVAHIDFSGAGPDTNLVLDYQNTSTYLLGAELDATDELKLRAGYRFNTAAEKDASVSPLLPEAERNYYSFGVGYRIMDGLGLDLAYQLVDQSDRRGRVRPRTSLEQTAEEVNVGVYSSDAHVFTATLFYHFGGF